jgi:hypothetical protein
MRDDKVSGCGCGCTTHCGHIAFERNRYFTGKYMAARDFQDEQNYFLSRHRLHNRVLHGWGIVCGLRVVPHPDPHCRERWVVVRAGIAIDCCGRELVLPKDYAFELKDIRVRDKDEPRPNATAEAAVQSAQSPVQLASSPAETAQHGGHHHRPGPFLICLRYDEDLIEIVPSLYADGDCDPSGREANRIRESACVSLCDREKYPHCWPRYHDGADLKAHCRDDCDDQLPGPAGICLDPECPCGDSVPLALVSYDPYDEREPLKIDSRGRRTLPTPPEFLTHIVGTNWRHGQSMRLGELRNEMDGKLIIHFDRKLKDTDGNRTGISEYTFVVEYGGVQRDLETLPPDRDAPPHVEDGCRAVFTIDRDYLGPRGRNLGNNVVYVTLHCDFILDCHGNPVDGNFLGARFPTGNGVRGGVFKSWFSVED